MFETAELGQVVDDETWEGHVDQVREGLLEVQQALRAADFPVIVVFAGIEKAGVGDTLNRLNTWMDPRGIRTLGYAMRDVEGRDLPPFWRYWSVLPTRGRMGMYDGAWYHQPLCSAIDQQINEATFDRELAEINAFEKMLADDGALILKFWLHLGAKQQADRLEALASDPDQSWRVQPSDWIELERHGQVAAQAEHMIARTSTPEAPWHIVEGTDPRFRDLRVSMLLLAAMQRRLDRPEAPSPAHDHWAGAPVLPRSILSTVDLKRSLKKSESRDLLPRAQGRLARLQREAQATSRTLQGTAQGLDDQLAAAVSDLRLSADAALRGDRMRARRKHLADAGRAEPRLRAADGGAQTRAAGADDHDVECMVGDGIGAAVDRERPRAVRSPIASHVKSPSISRRRRV